MQNTYPQDNSVKEGEAAGPHEGFVEAYDHS